MFLLFWLGRRDARMAGNTVLSARLSSDGVGRRGGARATLQRGCARHPDGYVGLRTGRTPATLDPLDADRSRAVADRHCREVGAGVASAVLLETGHRLLAERRY